MAELVAYKTMRVLLLSLLVVTTAFRSSAANESAQNAVWITGEVFSQDGVLLFRVDKPVRGNTTGDVVLLGPTKDTANVLGPVYMRAAERRAKLRLYGVLQAGSGALPPHVEELPSVQFITWKVHAPSDLDDLPQDQRISVGPSSNVSGYTVKPVEAPSTPESAKQVGQTGSKAVDNKPYSKLILGSWLERKIVTLSRRIMGRSAI